MDNIIEFIRSIATEAISALFGVIFTWLFITIKKAKNKPDQSPENIKYKRVLLLVRYFIVILIIVFSLLFLDISKLFIVFISIMFSILVLMLSYDFLVSSLKMVVKMNNKDKLNMLYIELEHSSSKEERSKIIKEIKQLTNS